MPEDVVSFSDLASANLLEVGAGRPRSAGLDRLPLPILRVADVAEDGVLPSIEINIPVTAMQDLGPKVSKPGDVVLTTKGTVGRVAIMPSDGPTFAYSPQLCYFRPMVNGPLKARYLYYWFKCEEFWKQADALKGQTDMADFISLSDLYSIRMRLPSIDEQAAVIDILGALDDKIAANRRAEKSARRVMRALVQGVQNNVLLSSLCSQSTKSLKPAEFDEQVAHFSLPAFDVGAGPEVTESAAIKSNKFLITSPCVLFSKLNPRIPRIWNVSSMPREMAVASTEFVVLSPTAISSSALWATVTQSEVSASLQQMVVGTSGSHQRVLPSALLSVQVRDVRTLAQEELQALDDLGQFCHEKGLETLRVERTRDALLPLLMSGKLTVRAAESLLEEVV